MNEECSTLEKKLDTFEQQAISVLLELKDGNHYVGVVSRNFATGEWQISTVGRRYQKQSPQTRSPFRSAK